MNPFSRCYFCGQKFSLPQELSRHIRDKVCKSNDKIQSVDECHEHESLSTISLLDLPIITEIPDDAEVTNLIAASQNHNTTAESLTKNDFMIIEHETNLSVSEQQQQQQCKDNDEEHPVLWGCKQCDFRFVKNAIIHSND